tara:strand:- start:2996 stop:3361 length:366 start_codon:yes stop_codon:yes gene_type:complete
MEIPTSRTTFPLRIPRRSKALGYLVEGLFINRGLESKSPTDTRPWTVGLEIGAGDGFAGFSDFIGAGDGAISGFDSNSKSAVLIVRSILESRVATNGGATFSICKSSLGKGGGGGGGGVSS